MASILGMRTRREGTGRGSWTLYCRLSGLLWDSGTSGGFPTELMIMEEVRHGALLFDSLLSWIFLPRANWACKFLLFTNFIPNLFKSINQVKLLNCFIQS